MFLHPAIFWLGLALAAAPVIIHLLNRRRYRVVPWAAMRFLLEAAKRNRRRVQFEQWLLLALRCLAVLLLALAVARFTGCSDQGVPVLSARGGTLHVFVVDDSVSMGQKLADATAIAKAGSDLAEMIAQLGPSDRIAILLTSEDGRTLLADPTQRPPAEVLANQLKALKASDTATRFGGALKKAREILSSTSSAKRLYVLSDFRAIDYAPGKIDAMKQELAAIAQTKAGVVLMNYGAPPSANLTLEDLTLVDKQALAHQPVRVQATVRNNGAARAENVSLSMSARGPDGQEFQWPPQLIDAIEPLQSRQVQVTAEFAQDGPARVQAELPGDSLAGDNRAFAAIDVRAGRRVLIVDGKGSAANPEDAAGFYLTSALDPTADGRYGNRVQSVSYERAGEIDLGGYDAVILAGVPELAPPVVKHLEEYVRAGGGLAIFTAPRINAEFYRTLYADGAGLMPVLLEPLTAPAGADDFARLAGDSIASDAVMRSFQGKNAAFTQFLRFTGHSGVAKVAPGLAGQHLPPARVLAEFQSSAGSRTPAIVERTFGDGASAGEVLAILTSADQSWTNWPKDYTFVTFANDLIDAIARRQQSRLGHVGEAIVLPASGDVRKAAVQTPAFPAQDEVPLAVAERQGQGVFEYEPTLQAGFYQVRLQGASAQRVVEFARNVDPAEGQLAQVSPEDLKQDLGVGFQFVDKSQGQTSAAAEGRNEYWKAALVALLALLAAEVFLGQRFGHYRPAVNQKKTLNHGDHGERNANG